MDVIKTFDYFITSITIHGFILLLLQGPVSFEDGDRIGSVRIEQLRGKSVKIVVTKLITNR